MDLTQDLPPLETLSKDQIHNYLTKETAHDLCVEMWNEMAEACTDGVVLLKEEVSFVNHPKFPLLDALNNCYVCEVYYGKAYLCENKCPFSKFGEGDAPCEWFASPYSLWHGLVYSPRIHSAADIPRIKQLCIEICDLFI